METFDYLFKISCMLISLMASAAVIALLIKVFGRIIGRRVNRLKSVERELNDLREDMWMVRDDVKKLKSNKNKK